MPNLPSPVVALVNRAMELDVNKRFATPTDLLAEIRAVQRHLEGDDDGWTADDSSGGRKQLAREGESKSVMVVESNADMQDALRDLLKRRGYRVLVISDPARALARFADDQAPSDCVIFGMTELGQSALDGFNKLGEDEKTRHIPAILFIEQDQQHLAEKADTAAHRVLVPMPLKVRQLRALLVKLLSHTPTES
jgi:serine/threonine-protein kinase